MGRRVSEKRLYSQTFNASGTWTRPAGVDAVSIYMAGGGGGGGANVTGGGGTGGGSGGFLALDNVPVSGNVTVTIGAGAPYVSYRGGATSFGSYSIDGGQTGNTWVTGRQTIGGIAGPNGSDGGTSGASNNATAGGGVGAGSSGNPGGNATANTGGGGGGGGGTGGSGFCKVSWWA